MAIQLVHVPCSSPPPSCFSVVIWWGVCRGGCYLPHARPLTPPPATMHHPVWFLRRARALRGACWFCDAPLVLHGTVYGPRMSAATRASLLACSVGVSGLYLSCPPPKTKRCKTSVYFRFSMNPSAVLALYFFSGSQYASPSMFFRADLPCFSPLFPLFLDACFRSYRSVFLDESMRALGKGEGFVIQRDTDRESVKLFSLE